IREFTKKEFHIASSDEEKINQVFSFLREIEKRQIDNPLFDQRAQPATRTFIRRYGSALDIAILGKAMLLSMGVNADILAVSDKRYNPKLTSFYSPTLFNTAILAAYIGAKPYFFDPEVNGKTNQLL